MLALIGWAKERVQHFAVAMVHDGSPVVDGNEG